LPLGWTLESEDVMGIFINKVERIKLSSVRIQIHVPIQEVGRLDHTILESSSAQNPAARMGDTQIAVLE